MDANEFIRNCNAHTLEELAPYEEHYVAWSEDGKRILAAARTEAELYGEIFTQVSMHLPLLGVAGGLEHFRTTVDFDLKEVVLLPKPSLPITTDPVP